MPHQEWTSSLTTSLPRFFNILSGRCTLVLSDRVVEVSKAVLSTQSPVLESYFMSSERDINKIIARRRARYLGEEVEGEDSDDSDSDESVKSDDEDDETSVIVMTDYYGYDDFVSEFFRSFYTGEITINADNIRVLLKLACQYEVSWVISECCVFLNTFLSEGNFIQNYKFLMNFKNDTIIGVVLEKLKTFKYHRLIDHRSKSLAEEWKTLDEALLTTFLDNMAPPSELYTAHLVFLWIEHDEPIRKHKLESLISHLRLVHVPQSFIFDVILKSAESMGVASKGLYRMVLGSQNYFFSTMAGLPPKRISEDLFPLIYQRRDSFVRQEEMSFTIPMSGLRDGVFENEQVALLLTGGKYRFRFNRECCFVFITTEAIVEHFPVSKLLIPVSEDKNPTHDLDQDRTISYLSDDIDIFDEILNSNMLAEKNLTDIQMVAVILDPGR